MTRYFGLVFLLLSFLSGNANAATLFGRVIEVNGGDVLTVFNLNRPVRVKLLAVDAPEAGQAFGDVAKKHLSDLVYDKSVLVEYSGIAADGSLIGRVTANGTDVGAQMIRDGAAWFDPSNEGRLSAADRDLYQQSEQAARKEKRGLWQAENPVAPWEFERAEALRRNPVASLNSVLPAARRANQSGGELTNLTLIGASVAPGSGPAWTREDPKAGWVPGGPPKNWQRFKPANENFSVMVPEHGAQMKIPVPFGERTVDINLYQVRDGWAVYALMWVTGPTFGESDDVAISGTVQGFMKGFGQGYERSHLSTYSCDLQGERRFSLNGFSGSEYDLPTCSIPTKIRAYTRVTRGVRQMYIGTVFYVDKDPNIDRFMKSFTAGAAARTKRAATKSKPANSKSKPVN